ncbi:MAG: alpha/beta hydrolase [Gammaproteobacteria bacterium]|nr:alpha/beta hydrolase [Gammaproteobacteria bacterium]MCP4832931.1 alpha/beta hydrolase [Gammaproteobacteria bacterium]MCP4930056.1 alpha/beta hydrolase [Gammaproteobacteria bacterium]
MKFDVRAVTAILLSTLVVTSFCILGCSGRGPATEYVWEETAGPLQYARVGDVDYAYFRFGSGPPLILICGITMTMAQWDFELLGELKDSFEVVIFDNPGIGESIDHSNAPLTIEGMAAGTVALAHNLGLERPNILGWSMGGEIATAIGALHSSEVDAIVVAAGNPGGPQLVPPQGEAFETLVNSSATGFARKREIASVLFPRDQTEAALLYGMGLLLIPQETVTKQAVNRQKVAVKSWKDGPGVWGPLGTTRSRMLFAGGDEDLIVPIENAVKMAAHVPNGSLKRYPDAGHAFLFQEPKKFATEVKKFLLSNTAAGDRSSTRVRHCSSRGSSLGCGNGTTHLSANPAPEPANIYVAIGVGKGAKAICKKLFGICGTIGQRKRLFSTE